MMVMALNMSIELHANYACKTTEKLCSKIRCNTDTTPWLKCIAAAIEIREQISKYAIHIFILNSSHSNDITRNIIHLMRNSNKSRAHKIYHKIIMPFQ